MTLTDKEWQEKLQRLEKSARRKEFLKKWFLYPILIIGVILFFFRHQIFDKKMTPEESRIWQENFNRDFNQMMLNSMEASEKESLEKLQEEKLDNDCTRNAITNGETPNTYMQKCANESSERNREKALKMMNSGQ